MPALARVLRLLVSGGLIPLVLAAGLPIRACACDMAASPAPTCCCGSSPSKTKGKTGGCACCKAACPAASEGGAEAKDGSPAGPSFVGCRCGSPQPLPATPASSALISVSDFALSTAPPHVVTPPREIASCSWRRLSAALLPVADLTTQYCALVI